MADVGQPTQIRACSEPFDKLRTGLPKDEGELISVSYAALPLPYMVAGASKGNRIPVSALKGRCPRPLDDGGSCELTVGSIAERGGLGYG